MAILRRGIVLAFGLGAAVATSQAPEFAQQYRQRLGGAVDELSRVVGDFDRDAAKSRLSRQQALESYASDGKAFLRDRGNSMRSTIARYERLSEQQADFNRLAPVMRPFALIETPDRDVVRRAWGDFEPAVPVTPHGFAWGGVGLAIGVMLAWAFSRIARWGWSERPRYGYRGVVGR